MIRTNSFFGFAPSIILTSFSIMLLFFYPTFHNATFNCIFFSPNIFIKHIRDKRCEWLIGWWMVFLFLLPLILTLCVSKQTSPFLKYFQLLCWLLLFPYTQFSDRVHFGDFRKKCLFFSCQSYTRKNIFKKLRKKQNNCVSFFFYFLSSSIVNSLNKTSLETCSFSLKFVLAATSLVLHWFSLSLSC